MVVELDELERQTEMEASFETGLDSRISSKTAADYSIANPDRLLCLIIWHKIPLENINGTKIIFYINWYHFERAICCPRLLLRKMK